MSENLTDLIFLLGTDCIKPELLASETLLEAIDPIKSAFIRNLVQIVNLILIDKDLEAVSTMLSLSPNFLKLLKPAKVLQGRCNICDKYFMKIKEHLVKTHLLNRNQVKSHETLFGSQEYFFMPMEYKHYENGIQTNYNKFSPGKLIDRVIKSNHPVALVSKLELEAAESSICADCGRIVPACQKYEHARNHRRNEMVQCPGCEKKLKKRLLKKHQEACKKYLPED